MVFEIQTPWRVLSVFMINMIHYNEGTVSELNVIKRLTIRIFI